MSRDALLRELRGLSRRELSLTLESLADEEREQVLLLINPPAAALAELPFATLAGLSPWLLKAIEPVEAPGEPRLTTAARAALLAALERAASASGQGQEGRTHKRASDTFIGRLLRGRPEARAN